MAEMIKFPKASSVQEPMMTLISKIYLVYEDSEVSLVKNVVSINGNEQVYFNAIIK